MIGQKTKIRIENYFAMYFNNTFLSLSEKLINFISFTNKNNLSDRNKNQKF